MVNNAGISGNESPGPVHEMKEETWDLTMWVLPLIRFLFFFLAFGMNTCCIKKHSLPHISTPKSKEERKRFPFTNLLKNPVPIKITISDDESVLDKSMFQVLDL